MPNVLFKTYGCRLNQAETAAISASFREHGYQLTSDISAADVYVLNTCVVTGRSAAKCLKDVRQALRANPHVTVILTGCYAHIQDEQLSAVKGIDYIVDNRMKYRLFDYFRQPGKQPQTVLISDEQHTEPEKALSRTGDFSHRTRASLKIQTGCDNRCAYCIVPFTRGPSRSVPLKQVMSEAEQLVCRGYSEIVITGVHIGDYGRDLRPRISLNDLLEELLTLPYNGRFRLSSLNGTDLTDPLIELLTGTVRICSHVHLSLQSGCDAILKRMNRPYTTASIRTIIHHLEKQLEYVGLGADVITGFPGESEAEAAETEQFISELPFTYLHVFPYSVRPGTAAAHMPSHVPSRIKQERAARLRRLAAEKHAGFLDRSLGRTLSVVLESKNRRGNFTGLSSEYVRVAVPCDTALVNRLIDVRITGREADFLTGTPLISAS